MPKITQKTRIIIYIAIAIAVIVMGAVAVLSQKSGGESLLGEKLELGQQYLVELSYDKAVLEFTDAINIEPKSADAYIGLAEAYKGLGDTEKAKETLEKGYELTGDERIKALLEELDKAEVAAAETTTAETTAVAETTTAETTVAETTTTEITTEETTVSETTEDTIAAETTIIETMTETTMFDNSIAESSEAVQSDVKKMDCVFDYAGMTMNEIAELFRNKYELCQGQYQNYAMYIPDIKYKFYPENDIYDANEFPMNGKISLIEIVSEDAYLFDGIKMCDLFDNWVKKSPDYFKWDNFYVESINFAYAYSIKNDVCRVSLISNIIADDVSFDDQLGGYVSPNKATDYKNSLRIIYAIVAFN